MMGNEELMVRNREFARKVSEELQLILDAARRMDIDGLREQMKEPGRLNSHLAELSDEELREYLVKELEIQKEGTVERRRSRRYSGLHSDLFLLPRYRSSILESMR